MTISEKIKEAVVAKKDASEIKGIAVSEGMMTMAEDGLIKVKMGLTTIEELLREVKTE
jgi:type IV pilus assembly protein PilB